MKVSLLKLARQSGVLLILGIFPINAFAFFAKPIVVVPIVQVIDKIVDCEFFLVSACVSSTMSLSESVNIVHIPINQPSYQDGGKSGYQSSKVVKTFNDAPENIKEDIIRGAIFLMGVWIIFAYICATWDKR